MTAPGVVVGCAQCRRRIADGTGAMAFGLVLCDRCAAGDWPRFLYLSGATNRRHASVSEEADIGHVATFPSSRFSTLWQFPYWAAENGCFRRGDSFDFDAYLAWLEKHSAFVESCIYAVAPDVVANAEATLARSLPAFGAIRRLGYPVAFVAQDGLEHIADRIPWQSFDVLFIGGSTEWKLSRHAERFIREANWRGKWTHMGRVNSGKRLRTAFLWGCDSADGTMLTWRTDIYLPRLRRQLGELRQQWRLWPAESEVPA